MADLSKHAAEAYAATQAAGYDLAHVLGVLDAGKAMAVPVDGASLIEALEAVQRSVIEARNAAIALCVYIGNAG